MPRTLPDGLDALREQLSVGEVMKLTETTAKWVNPESFRLLLVWYPEHAGKSLFCPRSAQYTRDDGHA
jgi:hypothetical protein